LTLFYLLNPKQFIDPGWAESSADPYRKPLPINIIQEIKDKIKEDVPRTKELKTRLDDFIETSQKIDQLSPAITEKEVESIQLMQNQIERERLQHFQRKVLVSIELMEEEELAVLLLCLIN